MVQAQEWLNENHPCNCSGKEYPYHQDCSRKSLHELNLRNLNLEGDLDLGKLTKRFINLRRIYLAGNPQLGEIKNVPHHTTLFYQNPQEWLNKKYSDKEKIKEIDLTRLNFESEQHGELVIDNFPNLKEIDGGSISKLTKASVSNCPQLETINITSSKNLSQLILNDLPNLKELNCSWNKKLTNLDLTTCPNLQSIICPCNQLAKIKLPKGEKVEILNLNNNNFHRNLSFLRSLVNLKSLDLGNNKFKGSLEYLRNINKLKLIDINNSDIGGSLEPLKKLTKLERLDISNTNIDSGLEYLPDSLKEFYCSVDKRDTKVRAIYNLFSDKQITIEAKNFFLELRKYKQEAREKARYFLADELIEKEQLKERVSQLEEELQMEREEAEKALNKAQEWRERQLKEITEQKDREIEDLKKQVSQLQSQLTSLQVEGQQALQIQPTNLPPNTSGSK